MALEQKTIKDGLGFVQTEKYGDNIKNLLNKTKVDRLEIRNRTLRKFKWMGATLYKVYLVLKH